MELTDTLVCEEVHVSYLEYKTDFNQIVELEVESSLKQKVKTLKANAKGGFTRLKGMENANG